MVAGFPIDTSMVSKFRNLFKKTDEISRSGIRENPHIAPEATEDFTEKLNPLLPLGLPPLKTGEQIISNATAEKSNLEK